MRVDKWTLALAKVLDRIRLGPRRKTKRLDNWEIVPRLPEALEDDHEEFSEPRRNRNLPVLLLLAGVLVWLIIQPPIFFQKPEEMQLRPQPPTPVSVPQLNIADSKPKETTEVSLLKPGINSAPTPSSLSPASIPPATPATNVVTVHPKVRAREAKVVEGDDNSDRFKVMPDPEPPSATTNSQP